MILCGAAFMMLVEAGVLSFFGALVALHGREKA
jgi:hypothetical protein